MVRYNLTELVQLDASLRVWTIGHSAHSWEQFILLLRNAGITAIADVRTSPYSRFSPHFNRDKVRDELRLDGISYVFLGRELGGRPASQRFYCEGVADYEKMAHAEDFKKGLERVIEGARKYKIALMCSEQDPMDCHRCLLIGRALAERGVQVGHIQANSVIATQEQIENRLLELSGRSSDDLFAPREDRLANAYRDRARKVAFAQTQPDPKGPIAAE
jgi:uncharacterized protein (DUF488 family)